MLSTEPVDNSVENCEGTASAASGDPQPRPTGGWHVTSSHHQLSNQPL